MRYSELSSRYAGALYDLANQEGVQDKVFAELRVLREVFQKDEDSQEFVNTPIMKASIKEQALKETLNNVKVHDLTKTFVYLLAKKGRLSLFEDVVNAYEARSDEEHQVTRGNVCSPTVLDNQERKQIEKFVADVTKKKVILTYSEDPDLIGGMVAKVGSYSFDDSLSTHLKRLNDELKRSTH